MSTENSANDKFAFDELLKRSWNLRNSKDFCKFIDFIAKLNHYSRFNTMLVFIQNKDVAFFGGESYWLKNFGRSVKKDARPYIILAPKSPVMLAYDIMETEGYESPKELLANIFEKNIFKVGGHLDPKIYEGAINTARNWGISIMQKSLSYFEAGYVTTSVAGKPLICLKLGATIEENFTVLLHELAHILCGHTEHKELRKTNSDKSLVLPERRKLRRSTEELEAETVSYFISTKLSLIPRSEEYLAIYIKNIDDLLQFSYETVIKVADKIETLFLKPIKMMVYSGQGTLFD